MTLADVNVVAELHCSALTGLLRDLGPAATRAFYRGALRSGFAHAFVDIEDRLLRGFVFGSAQPNRLRSATLRANLIGIGIGIGAGVVRCPAAMVSLLRSLRGPDEGSYDTHVAELTYIATVQAARASGVGSRLVQQFEAALGEQGVRTFELSVDQHNTGALRFYEKIGFVAVGTYREFGVIHRRYRKSVSTQTRP